MFSLGHESHPLASAGCPKSHWLRLPRRINRGPFIDDILDQFRTTQPNKVRSRTLSAIYIAILVPPFGQPPGKLGLQMDEGVIDDWRAWDEGRQVFPAGVGEEEFVHEVDGDKEHCAEDHGRLQRGVECPFWEVLGIGSTTAARMSASLIK